MDFLILRKRASINVNEKMQTTFKKMCYSVNKYWNGNKKADLIAIALQAFHCQYTFPNTFRSAAARTDKNFMALSGIYVSVPIA